MRYVQLAVIEAPGGCNLTARHPECPAGALGRDRPAAKPMPWYTAVEIAGQLAGLGFRGFYGFHFFSEPMLAQPWVAEVMAGIRKEVPGARFALWTNGTGLDQDREMWAWAATFNRIFLSNYLGQEWSGLEVACEKSGAKLYIWQEPVFAPAMKMAPDPDAFGPRPRCLRPYTEFTITRTGDALLCCMAWRPEQALGNVLVDGVAECVRRYKIMRDDASDNDPRRPLCLAHPCRGCAAPEDLILEWDRQIAREARRHADEEAVGVNRRPGL